MRQRVRYPSSEKTGTLVVNTSERFLFAVEDNRWATRYEVAVGEEGLTLKGRATVGRKAGWPSWPPTAGMIQRKPRLQRYAGGVPGGDNNPLSARTLTSIAAGKIPTSGVRNWRYFRLRSRRLLRYSR